MNDEVDIDRIIEEDEIEAQIQAQEEDHIEKMAAATQKLCACVVDLNLPSAAVIDVMSVVLAEVVARTATDRNAIPPIMQFVNNRVEQMIKLYEEAGLPAWTKKADA